MRERRLQPGDEVITAAAGFPTTLKPILQNGLVPVFVDVDAADLQRRRPQLEAAPRTEHARDHGRPHAGQSVRPGGRRGVRREHDLWLIEDCCDALGATYDGQPVGTFGDLATLSASIPPTTSPWARAARS